MNEEISYPIKYAVLELIEKRSWYGDYQEVSRGLIASKCYVIGSSIEYRPDGNHIISHKVIFPWDDITTFLRCLPNGNQNIGNENVPSYNAFNRPYECRVVENLYDSYEEAKVEAEEKNKNRRYQVSTYGYVPDTLVFPREFDPSMRHEPLEIVIKKIEQKLQVYDKYLEDCYLFEQLVTEANKDMEISGPLEVTPENTLTVLRSRKRIVKKD